MPDSLQVLNITRHSLTQLLASSVENSAGTTGVDPQEIDNTIEGLKGYAQGVRLSLNQQGYALQTDTIKAENGAKGVIDVAVPYGVQANFLSNNQSDFSVGKTIDKRAVGIEALFLGWCGWDFSKLIAKEYVRKFDNGILNKGFQAIRNAVEGAAVVNEELHEVIKYKKFLRYSGRIGAAVCAVGVLAKAIWDTKFWQSTANAAPIDLRVDNNGYDNYMAYQMPSDEAKNEQQDSDKNNKH